MRHLEQLKNPRAHADRDEFTNSRLLNAPVFKAGDESPRLMPDGAKGTVRASIEFLLYILRFAMLLNRSLSDNQAEDCGFALVV